MLISLKNKYICLNPPKVGTGYRENVLNTHYEYSMLNERKHQRETLTNQGITPDKNNLSSFSELRHLNIQRTMSWVNSKNIQIDDDIFWFTFTRNPWDRAVSFYNMYINWNCNHLFEINSLVVDKEPKITSEYFIKFLKSGLFNWYEPQITYIQYKDFKVDFIGKLETIHHDMSHIISRLNLQDICIDRKQNNQQQSRIKRYDHLIREMWTDEIIDYIAEFDKDVINLQGYDFKP
tara:strand:+ start:1953 stop:2657 length:705 start_codon:yes stop_codon:yes gene_type:complete